VEEREDENCGEACGTGEECEEIGVMMRREGNVRNMMSAR
jgi:hypothetical protein